MAEILPELEPELGPEVEVTARALPRLGLLALLYATLGMILAVDAIVRGFFGTVSGAVGWIPYLGHLIEEPIHKIEQKVVSFLSGLEADIDSAIAHNIHVLAQLLHQFWRGLEYMAANIVLLGLLAVGATATYVIGPLKRWVHGLIRKVETEIKHAERVWHHTKTTVTHVITHVVAPQIKNVTVALPKYIHRELLTIRHDAGHAEKTALRALRRAESIPFPRSAKTWAAAVAVALPKLGLDWLRCESNPFKNNPNACGLWNGFKDLLGVLADVFLFTHFCDLWAKATPLLEIFLAPVVGIIATFADGACSHRPSDWLEMGVPLYTPTPREITATLPEH